MKLIPEPGNGDWRTGANGGSGVGREWARNVALQQPALAFHADLVWLQTVLEPIDDCPCLSFAKRELSDPWQYSLAWRRRPLIWKEKQSPQVGKPAANRVPHPIDHCVFIMTYRVKDAYFRRMANRPTAVSPATINTADGSGIPAFKASTSPEVRPKFAFQTT